MEVISQSEVKTSVQTEHEKKMTLLLKNTAGPVVSKFMKFKNKTTLSRKNKLEDTEIKIP